MQIQAALIAAVMLLANYINTEPAEPVATYVVSAPRYVRPLSTYTVFASLHNVNKPLNITVTISSNTGQKTTGQASVSPRSSSEIKLQIADWTGVAYMLVQGTGAVSFNSSQNLTVNSKKCSVFIQTDKAIYQPSQTAKFRVFVINSELQPYTSYITIYISDPLGNRIQQYLNSTLDKGVFSGELQLSDQPVLGDWTIQAIVGSTDTAKSITVKEYVLPTFEVTLFTPTFALFNDTASPIRVEAKYTFGKPVQGNVILYVSDSCHEQKTSTECLSRPNISATLDKKGQAVIQLDVSTIHYPPQIYSSKSTLNLVAIVTEDLTGNTANDTGLLNLYPYKEKLSISASLYRFRPALPLYITAVFSDQDNIPITISPDAPINFSISYHSVQNTSENRLVPMSANGTAMLELEPSGEIESMTVQAFYKTISSSNLYISIEPSLSKNYILLELNTEKYLTAGDVATFRIRSTFSFDQLLYEIVSGGQMLESRLLNLPLTNDYNLLINTTHDMTPQSHIIVYTISLGNEIFADSIDYYVDGFFITPVKLSANPNETEPGKSVDVVVDTNPSAIVYLTGIDQSILLLKSGNDITKQEVEQDFAMYKGDDTPIANSQVRVARGQIADLTLTFLDADIILITNAAYRQGTTIKNSDIGAFPVSPQPSYGTSLRIRKQFPETWIYDNITADTDGKAVLSATTPDTITSWIISATVMDYITGIGFSDDTTKVTVFKPFFVSLNLPYSIVRGETLNLQALVFNYLQDAVQANVTLSNEDGEFEFTEEPKNASSQSKIVMIPSGETVSAVFPIIVRIVGYVKIKVSAISLGAGDIIQKELLTKAEGTTKYFNRADRIDLRVTYNYSLIVDIEVPTDVVPDSKRVQISVIGDTMGPTLNNIDSLLRAPYGCGEQNMMDFVPNIIVANYLLAFGGLTTERKNKAISNIASGYQRELTFKHPDGSYSAFGNKDIKGSTWLTAYVLKSFFQAKPYITISDSILNDGLQYLNSTQNAGGTFVENGSIFHKSLQGGSATSGLSMTAYICISFLVIGNPSYQPTAKACIAALERRLPNATDPYEVAIMTYALHLGNSSVKDNAFSKLQGLGIKDGDCLYWGRMANGTGAAAKTQSYETGSTNSLNVEATAYSLLTYVLRDNYNGRPIYLWMVRQRNEFGAFASTQDTVIGLEALSKFGQVIGQVNVNCKYGDGSTSFTITKENALVLLQKTLPPETNTVQIEATGYGTSIVQVTWSYNIPIINNYLEIFSINATVDTQTEYSYKLTVCALYISGDKETSNMAIIELNALSGYNFDRKYEPAGADMVEYDLRDTRINLYYYTIGSNQTCTSATATKNNDVYNLKDAEVKVYDYYQPGNKAKCSYLKTT